MRPHTRILSALGPPAVWLALAMHLGWWIVLHMQLSPLVFFWPATFAFSFGELTHTARQEDLLLKLAIVLAAALSFAAGEVLHSRGWLRSRRVHRVVVQGVLLFLVPPIVLTGLAVLLAILMGWSYTL